MSKDKEKPKEAGKGKKKAKESAGMRGQVLILALIVSACVFLASSALLFIGMMPTVAAAIVDRSRKKTKAMTVGAMNLSGCAPFLFQLWYQGDSFHKAIDIVMNPMAIVVMYSAAAVGYLIDWAMAGIVSGIMYQKALARQKSIRTRQQELIQRWGPEVTGEMALDEQGFPLESQPKLLK